MERKFTLTTSILRMWHNQYNVKYFGGKLPMPTFKFNNATSRWGSYKYDRYFCTETITMSTHFDRTEKDFQNTFIHEMIHQWQWHTFKDCNHGRTFKEKAYIINRDGWNIKRCSDDNGAEVVKGMEKTKELQSYTYLFTWTTDKGVKLFRHARVSCIENLKNKTKKSNFYNNVELYKVVYTPELKHHFREAVSSLGGYDYYNYKTMVDNLISRGVRLAV